MQNIKKLERTIKKGREKEIEDKQISRKVHKYVGRSISPVASQLWSLCGLVSKF